MTNRPRPVTDKSRQRKRARLSLGTDWGPSYVTTQFLLALDGAKPKLEVRDLDSLDISHQRVKATQAGIDWVLASGAIMDPLFVSADNFLIDGKHRRLALLQSGVSEALCLVFPLDFVAMMELQKLCERLKRSSCCHLKFRRELVRTLLGHPVESN